MKKGLALLFVVLLGSFAACNKSDTETTPESQPTVEDKAAPAPAPAPAEQPTPPPPPPVEQTPPPPPPPPPAGE